MKPQHKKLVQESWAKVVPIADQAAALFYGQLFTIDPALERLFAKTDIKKQGRMLMSALNLTVKGLDEPATLLPVLESMGRRHAGYGVRDEHYDTVGQALLWTLNKGLGAGFTAQVKAAWVEAYTLVASVMKAAAHKKAA